MLGWDVGYVWPLLEGVVRNQANHPHDTWDMGNPHEASTQTPTPTTTSANSPQGLLLQQTQQRSTTVVPEVEPPPYESVAISETTTNYTNNSNVSRVGGRRNNSNNESSVNGRSRRTNGAAALQRSRNRVSTGSSNSGSSGSSSSQRYRPQKWPHKASSVFACLSCVVGLCNVSRFSILVYIYKDVFDVFDSIDELSRLFKDNFCLPLLNLLHEKIGRKPLYGMRGLIDELKLYILEYLPIEDVVSMSAVNKCFHDLAKSSLLWKHLYKRDFPKAAFSPDSDVAASSIDWKQMYKTEYLKKKQVLATRTFLIRSPRYRLPQIFPVGPDFDMDLGIHFDPPFAAYIQPRFPF